jgi:hypothetical protein
MNKVRLSFTVIALIVLSACGPAFVTPSVQSSVTDPQPACQPSQIQQNSSSFPEIQARMKSPGEIWALLFFEQAQVGSDLKIVWRINGGSDWPDFQAASENGRVIRPIWGPEYHERSTWERPGEEWGTGFNFPEPGCWTITVARGEATGEIQLMVAIDENP